MQTVKEFATLEACLKIFVNACLQSNELSRKYLNSLKLATETNIEAVINRGMQLVRW